MAIEKQLQLKAEENGTEVNIYPYTKADCITFNNGNSLEENINKHNHSNATIDKDGSMSKEDKALMINMNKKTNDLETITTIHNAQLSPLTNQNIIFCGKSKNVISNTRHIPFNEMSFNIELISIVTLLSLDVKVNNPLLKDINTDNLYDSIKSLYDEDYLNNEHIKRACEFKWISLEQLNKIIDNNKDGDI